MSLDIKSLFKKAVPHIIAILVLLVINLIFFYPQLEGKRIVGGDTIAATAWSAEVNEFKERTGKEYYWNNGIFSGMPWMLLNVGREDNYVGVVNKILKGGINRPGSFFLKAMILCYLSLVFLGLSPWLAVIGAIGYSLNVNFIVLMEAGHLAKVEVLSNFPLLLAGLILCFRQKYLLGGISIAVGTSLSIYGNHIQMVYYLLLCFVLMFLIHAFYEIKSGRFQPLLKGMGVAALAATIGAITNFTQLSSSLNFSQDTMRGKPILAAEEGGAANTSSAVDGLDWTYAMQWSNNFGDLLSVIVPGVVGGSSGEEVSAQSELGRLLRNNGARVGSDGNVHAPTYWGNLPFTSGPYYLGATLLLLFVCALFFLNPALRIGVLSSFILISLLSMGSEASILNKPLFDNFPLFNKFRSPNSSVNILPLFVVIPAMLGLHTFLASTHKKLLLKRLWQGTVVVGGVSLLFLLLGSGMLSFTGAGDARYSGDVLDIIVDHRATMVKSDSFRSLIITLISAGLIWAFITERLRSEKLVLIVLGLVVLVDFLTVDRRYLDADSFQSERDFLTNNLSARPVDNQIKQLEPKGRGFYRVFDLSISTFNSSTTSYHHNTIGGYHPAKLQRYEDVKNYYLLNGNQNVLNMLNSKYVITREQQLQVNNTAFGNGWFVSEIVLVNSPVEEIKKVGDIDPARQAVILETEFKAELNGFRPGSGEGSITLTEYEPDHLIYQSSTSSEELAVFSEVWYGPDKGWEVLIDNEPANMLRANYILRALRVPSGEHKIEFVFTPHRSGLWVTRISSILLIGLLLYSLYLIWRDSKIGPISNVISILGVPALLENVPFKTNAGKMGKANKKVGKAKKMRSKKSKK